MKAMLTYVLSALSGLVARAAGILINAPSKAAPPAFPSAGGEPPSGIAAPLFDAHHDCLVAANEPCPDCASTRALWTYFQLDDLPAWALREIEQGLR
ncbi:hypothetical protein KB221_13065 [Aquidulcibacter paucihalophilus]|jgi:hypothetical protein|nr:hypothetical protein KB221_13065 [Aquidulcibacter paucihalophilus]